MKCVSGRVDADEALAVADRVNKSGLAVGCHRRVSILAGGKQVAAGIEHQCIESRQILRREEAAVFGEREINSVLRSNLAEQLFNEAWLPVLALDYGMFEV